MRKSLQYLPNEADVDSHLKALNLHKPDFIISDLSVLKNIAIYARKKGLDLPSVKVLFVGSELIDGNSRQLLQNSFNAKVIEHYGSEEAGTMAMECPKGQGLHIVWRANYIEILNNGKKSAGRHSWTGSSNQFAKQGNSDYPLFGNERYCHYVAKSLFMRFKIAVIKNDRRSYR